MNSPTLDKTLLCQCEIWALGKPLPDEFAIKVPNQASTRKLRDALRRIKQESATYFSPTGIPLYHQWFLKKSQHKELWLAGKAFKPKVNYE